HLVFRSQGGGDEPDNVVGLCSCCHLQLIHTEGSVKAEAPSTHMSWKTPVLEVEGREVVWRRRVTEEV
ncbi:MAG: HNH endonuclease, partial [Myxococcota bacterium]